MREREKNSLISNYNLFKEQVIKGAGREILRCKIGFRRLKGVGGH
jgi:hypothetical protein